MLRSRAIARSSVSSIGGQRQLYGRSSPIPSTRLAPAARNGRQFGTLPQSLVARTPLASSGRAAAPVALGTVASARTLSLWGYGTKKTTTTPLDESPAASIQPPQATQATQASQAAQATQPSISNVPKTPEHAPFDPDAVAPSDFDLSSITSLVQEPAAVDMPDDTLGYLSSIGLDYGWGPTSVMQWCLEHLHVWGGLGWAGSIITLAALMRLALFYPSVLSLRFGARMAELRKDDRYKQAIGLIRQSASSNDPTLRQKGSLIQKELNKEYGVSYSSMAWGFLPIPFSFGMFRLVTGMVNVPVPSLADAGWLWFTDLTVSDPYFLLPAAATGVMILGLKVNSKFAPPAQKKMMKNMAWFFGFVGFGFATYFSAAVNIMALSLAGATLLNSVILNTVSVRHALGLPVPSQRTTPPDLPSIPTTARAPGMAGLRDKFSDNLSDVKKGLSSQVSNITGQFSGSAEEKAAQRRKETMEKLEGSRKVQERDEFMKRYNRPRK